MDHKLASSAILRPPNVLINHNTKIWLNLFKLVKCLVMDGWIVQKYKFDTLLNKGAIDGINENGDLHDICIPDWDIFAFYFFMCSAIAALTAEAD